MLVDIREARLKSFDIRQLIKFRSVAFSLFREAKYGLFSDETYDCIFLDIDMYTHPILVQRIYF